MFNLSSRCEYPYTSIGQTLKQFIQLEHFVLIESFWFTMSNAFEGQLPRHAPHPVHSNPRIMVINIKMANFLIDLLKSSKLKKNLPFLNSSKEIPEPLNKRTPKFSLVLTSPNALKKVAIYARFRDTELLNLPLRTPEPNAHGDTS